MRFLPVLLALALPLLGAEPFEIREGDRVVLLGDALLERENTYGYLETRMHEQFPERSFTVRNISWAGDTPKGWSRASFDPAEKGMERLREAIELTRPTVVFLGYGMAASLQEMTDRAQDPTLNPDPARYGREPMSAARFKKELGELMTAIEATAAKVNPVAASKSAQGGASLSGVKEEGRLTAQESSAASTSAEVAAASEAKPAAPKVGDQTPQGKVLATNPDWNVQVPYQWGLKPPFWSAINSPLQGKGTVRFVLLSPIRHEDLRAVKPGLPDPAPHNALLEQYSKVIGELAQERGARFVDVFKRGELHAAAEENNRQSIPGLVRIDGRPNIPHVTDNGVNLYGSGYVFLTDELEKQLAWTPQRPFAWKPPVTGHTIDPRPRVALNAAVLRKNAVFFHRFRPANLTYLTGFRKHEQGQNAVEIAEFDALVAAADAEIDRLKRSPAAASAPAGTPDTPGSEVSGRPGESNSPGAEVSGRPGTMKPPGFEVSGRSGTMKPPGSEVSGRPGTTKPPGFETSGPPGATKPPGFEALGGPETAKPPGFEASGGPETAKPPGSQALGGAKDANTGVSDHSEAKVPEKSVAPTQKDAVLVQKSGQSIPVPDFTVLDGYQIELWAENPHLEKPTQMNWDAQGRLWVASSSTYPQVDPQDVAITMARTAADSGKGTTENTERTEAKKDSSSPAAPPSVSSAPSVVPKPRSSGDDKILILEDTDRDGRADKSTVFADGLLIPTGVVPDLQPGGLKDISPGQRPGSPASNGARPEGAQERSSSAAPAGAGAVGDAKPRVSPGANLPQTSGLAPSACYVAQSTELLHLADTDGDGRADQRRVVFSGFGTEDTHHLLHTLRWGPDGRLYFNQSVYIHSHLETPWGMVRLNAGGVFAYDPRTERVEVFCKGLWNTWGHAWDDWGQSFLTDGAGRDGISWAFPGAVFAPSEGARKTTVSVSPGSYPKFCGLEIVKSPHFPADWQGNAITCDFRAHRVVRFAIDDLSITAENAEHAENAEKKKGSPASPSSASSASSVSSAVKSGYVTKELPDLLRTSDASFRPIDVRLGPDGALYIADWSNPVINHGEVDFRDPRRDKERGRIWRITKKDTPVLKWEPLPQVVPAAQPSNDGTVSPPANAPLLDKLLSRNAWEIEQARRVLLKADVVLIAEETDRWLKHRSLTAGRATYIGPTSFATLSLGFGLSKSTFLATDGASPQIRAGAIRFVNQQRLAIVLPQGKRDTTNPHYANDLRRLDTSLAQYRGAIDSSIFETLGKDENPRNRLEAMRALARTPTGHTAELVLAAARNAPKDDPHYEFAAWQSINDLAVPWTDAIASGVWKADTADREAQLAWGLKAIDPALAGATLAKLVADKKVPLDGTGPWFELIGTAGGPAELQPLWDSLLVSFAGNCCETDETRALEGKVAFFDKTDIAARAMAAVLEAARTRNVRPAERTHLASALFHVDHLRTGAVELAGLWKSPEAIEKLQEIGAGADLTPELRRVIFRAARVHGSPEGRAFIESYCAPETPAEVRREAVLALAALDFPKAAAFLPAILATLPDEKAALPYWRELLAIKGAPDQLAGLFATERWKNVAKPLRAAREAGKPAAKLLAALGPVEAAPRDYKALANSARTDGDPVKGELIYRRANLACVTCHAIGGAGGKVGPDMTSLGASAPLDYIIESVLAPALKVKEGYNALSVTMLDGLVVSGVQVRETAAELVVRDAIGKEQSIPKGQIKARTDIGSIMPAGLVDQLPHREQMDLFHFLGELGKPGPYDASKGSVARYWRLYPGDASPTPDLAANPGFPGYPLVDGRFIKEQLAEAAQIAAAGQEAVLAVTQFQGNPAGLKLTGAEKVWLDGQPLAVDPAGGIAAAALAPTDGVHTLAVQLRVAQLPPILRAETPQARFLGN